jgi:hypothetical protein
MSWRLQTFKAIRRSALRQWLSATQRSRSKGYNDDFSSAYECRWQGRCEASHNALFCGIGEWACHITDILSDSSCDNLRFTNEEHKRRLVRQYARLIFVCVELLNDFQDALEKAGLKGNVRVKLGDRVSDLQPFCNQVIKHKAKGLHRHDHHLPILFADSPTVECERVIRLGVKDLTGRLDFDCIQMPRLCEVVDIVLTAYANFDSCIEDASVFAKLDEHYGDELSKSETIKGLNKNESETLA